MKKPYVEKPTSNDKLPDLFCKECDLTFNSPSSAQQHFSGKRHAQTIAENALYVPTKRQYPEPPRPVTKSAEPTIIKKPYVVEKPASNDKLPDLLCNDCGVMFNSATSAQQHFLGRKHAQTIADNALSSASLFKNSAIVQHKKENVVKEMYCSMCNLQLTSQTQLQQHYNGVRHKLKAGVIKEPPEWWKG